MTTSTLPTTSGDSTMRIIHYIQLDPNNKQNMNFFDAIYANQNELVQLSLC